VTIDALIPTEVTAPSVKAAAPERETMSRTERCKIGIQLAELRTKEYLQFDARLLHAAGATTVGQLATLIAHSGQFERGFHLLGKLHRGAYSPRTTRLAERFVRSAIANRDPRLKSLIEDVVHNSSTSRQTANFFNDPLHMLGRAVLVLKSPSPGQKGVLILWYNHIFSLFARFFDVPRIMERYHLVLEPSWSGCCDLDILAYTQFPGPIFVQAFEPHDARFLTSISSNLVPVPTASNWWVDHQRLYPRSEIKKEFDVVMVAAWGDYKRHHQFFRALAKLRGKGRRLQVLLLGNPAGWSKEVILRHARYHGVRDQIVLKQGVPYDEVNAELNRAKVHVLWSRREGVNRAIIEAMFAGLPCVIREGFNYGYRYPYVNASTGCFASERSLPTVLDNIVSNYEHFAPREWVMENMTCEIATNRVARVIAETIGDDDDKWVGRLAVKINELSSMRYFDPSLRDRFLTDYDFLRTTLRKHDSN
jgi:glycosyltransferase involved in cell wall biosynthesis